MKKSKQELAREQREWRKKNPDKVKNTDLKKRFGITLTEYNDMLSAQDHVCAICGQEERAIDHRTKAPRSLAVDHCHETNKVRGLLCTYCNTGIGLLQDSPDLLESAIKYLRSP